MLYRLFLFHYTFGKIILVDYFMNMKYYRISAVISSDRHGLKSLVQVVKDVFFPRKVAKFKIIVVVWFLNIHLNLD